MGREGSGPAAGCGTPPSFRPSPDTGEMIRADPRQQQQGQGLPLAPLPTWPASPSSLQAVCVSFSKYELLSFTLPSLWPSQPALRKEPATIRATSVRMGVAALKGIRTGSEGECDLEESRWACMSRGPRERLDPAQTACGLPFVHSFTHSLIHSTSPSPFSGHLGFEGNSKRHGTCPRGAGEADAAR